jgi:hypothetical protein
MTCLKHRGTRLTPALTLAESDHFVENIGSAGKRGTDKLLKL